MECLGVWDSLATSTPLPWPSAGSIEIYNWKPKYHFFKESCYWRMQFTWAGYLILNSRVRQTNLLSQSRHWKHESLQRSRLFKLKERMPVRVQVGASIYVSYYCYHQEIWYTRLKWGSLTMNTTYMLACVLHHFSLWVRKIPWRRNWWPTPVFLPGESHGQRSLGGSSPWCWKESDMIEGLTQTDVLFD